MIALRPAENPFASQYTDTLDYRFVKHQRGEIEARLDALGGRAAIVGPQGSGKTTFLEQFARSLDGDVYLIMLTGESRRPWPAILNQLPLRIDDRHTVLVDCAGRLGGAGIMMLRAKTRRAGRLVITCHRTGPLPTLMRCRTSPGLLLELVRELAKDEAERLGIDLGELFIRHQGNLRLCFRELYDVFAGRRSFRSYGQSLVGSGSA